MSYYNISKKILSYSKIQISNQTEQDIYLYSIETLLSIVINSMILFILAFSFHLEIEFLCFLIFFIPLRTYGGGIHAKNHFQCILLFAFLLLTSILISVPISNSSYYIIFIMLVLLFKLICALLQNKYFKNHNTKIACFLSIAASFVIVTLLFFNQAFSAHIEYYITLSSFGIFTQTLTSVPILFQKS